MLGFGLDGQLSNQTFIQRRQEAQVKHVLLAPGDFDTWIAVFCL